MGFIKAEAQPRFLSTVPGQPSASHADHFAFLPYPPPTMDGLQPSDLCKPGIGSDGRSKVARACTECKARKMRCDGGLPFCGRCITHSRTKSCAYVDPPKRSPITRQYVSSLESQLEEANKRIAEFEAKANSSTIESPTDPSSGVTEIKTASAGARAAEDTTTEPSTPASKASPAASTSTRSRAWTVGQGLSAAERADITSKKRTRTYGSGEPEFPDTSASKSLEDHHRHVAHCLNTPRQFTSLQHIYPPPKSLVERANDGIGAGSFIGLSTGTAVLRVISQLCKAAQSTRADAQGHVSRDANLDEAHAGHEKLDDSPELTCESLVRIDTSPVDEHGNTFGRFSTHLLPSDANVAAWSEANRLAANVLLTAYFELHHPAYPILHRPTFKAQLAGELPRPNVETWPMLLNMVFALGSFESRLSADEPELDLHYYGLARKAYNTAIFSQPNLVTVQALALMANYCQKRNFYSTSWMVLGTAIRMAISLELHLENPASTRPKPALEKELERRLWWSLYAMEADIGLSSGQPNSLLGIPSDLALPRNIDDDDVTMEDKELPEEKEGPTTCSTLISHSKFTSDISLPIQARLVRAPNPAIEEIRAFDLTIQDYVDRLPDYMQASGLEKSPGGFNHAATRLRWRCNNLRMVMFRPFLLSAALSASVARRRGAVRPALRPAVKQAIALCRQLAKENVESIAQYWDSHEHNQAASWHAAFFLTQSAFIPLVSIIDDPASPDADDWLDVLNTCKLLLEDIGTVTAAALKCRDLIQSVTAGLLDDHTGQSLRAQILGGLQSPADPATFEPVFWAQPYAASASSDGTDLSEIGGPLSLGFSLGSIGSDGMPMFDLHSQIVQTSPEHRPSLAETIDAWAAVRPTTGSQWSDTGSHSSLNADTRRHATTSHQLRGGGGDGDGNNAANPSIVRQRHVSATASMSNSWTYGFHLSDTQGHHDPPGVAEASLFAPYPTRSLVAGHGPSQGHVGDDADGHPPESASGFGEAQWRPTAPGSTHDAWWPNLSDLTHDDRRDQLHHPGPHLHHGGGGGAASNISPATHASAGDQHAPPSASQQQQQQQQHGDHFFDHAVFSTF
ncbi:hypothetical protein ACQY0O_001020 [Thecaphora frezii]